MPASLAVRCPRCAACAAFDEAFDFLVAPPAETPASPDPRPVHRWGSWYVRERFPALVGWSAPRGSSQYLQAGGHARGSGAHQLRDRGVLRCPACHYAAAHALRWPEEAYFRWNVRGTRLWADDAEQARVLLHYVESTRRDPARYPGHERLLRRLPAPVLAARNRALVSRAIRQSFQAARLAAEPPPLRGDR